MAPTASHTPTKTAPPPGNAPRSNAVEKLTLLVVDDEAGPRESLKMVFQSRFQVLSASSGEAGIALAQEHPVALAIVDIRMQGMDGIEVLQALKRLDEKTEVIILTAYETLQTARDAVRHGASDYLSKPFDIWHIQQVVDKCAKRFEISRERQSRADEDISRAKNEFLAILSHELNTPMNGIIGLQELLAQTNLTSEQGELLRDIEECSYNLFGKINDILQYARLTTEAYTHSTEVFNPSSLILKLPEEPPANKKGLTIHYTLGDPLPDLVQGPEYEIQIILLKLLDNACKFTSEGEVEVSLNAEPHNEEEMDLVFAVRDTGIGIPPEALADRKIFEPFSQGQFSNNRAHEGLGMGLALCNRLTHQIGSSLRITNNEDRGSTVSFRVRVQLCESDTAPS